MDLETQIKLAKIVGEIIDIHEEPISTGNPNIDLSMTELYAICERWKNERNTSEPHLPLADVSGAVCGCERDYVCGLCYKQKGYKVVNGKLQTDH